MRTARIFGTAHVIVGTLLGLAIAKALPARVWFVDAPGILLAGLLVTSGLGLLANAPRAHQLARWTATLTLALGLLVVLLLAWSASFLAAIYGPVGRGGSIVFIVVGLLVVPYLVVLPGALLFWLKRDP